MHKRAVAVVAVFLFLCVPIATAQTSPWYQWTFLDAGSMDEIIGEVSGETAWNSTLVMGGYNRDRRAPEFEGTFIETRHIIKRNSWCNNQAVILEE